MRTLVLKSIVEATFRASPRYDLALFDRLPQAQQEVLRDLQKDADFYGILRPRASEGLGIKSVCRDTALLYLTLREPGRLPTYVKTMFGEHCNQAIAELVLDGVLEIECNGVFVAGAEAHGLIYEEEPSSTAQGTISQLSLEALQYGQALEIHDSARLSARLYCYNRLPLSPFWMRMFPSSDAVAEHLGIQAAGLTNVLLHQHWSQVPLSPAPEVWWVWRSRHVQPTPQQLGYAYKLYVSPACSHMREAFRATVAVLSQLRAPSFKVGKDVYGLLRPDKLVAYFWSFDALAEAVELVRHALEGIPAQGVPFTAEIAGNGLLSWGIDPPAEQQVLSWQARESWRLWMTNRLATALLAAKATSTANTIEPWQFALERLRLEGVDTDSWTLAETIWQTDFKAEG